MTDDVTCRICRLQDAAVRHSYEDVSLVSCPRCGHYSISRSAAIEWENKVLTERQIAHAAGWVREHQHAKISTNELATLENLPLPTIGERAWKILAELERRSPELGTVHNIQFGTLREAAEWMGISWSVTIREVAYLFESYLMETLGLIQGNAPHSIATPNALALINLKITPRGYAQLEESRQRNLDSQLGFCAMWFDAELEFLWVDCIEPAIALAGYEPKRIDRHPHNNKIDDEIVAMIRRSKFVVADFTGQRGGVYFEAGFAKGLGLEVIWTVRKDELDEHKVHFDNRQFNFVTWESNRLEDFKNRLQFRIEATLGRGKRMPEVAASGSLV